MDPACDELLLVGFSAQRALPDGERAHVAQQRLEDDEADRREVQPAEPAIAREGTAEREPDPGGEEPADDEGDERRVRDEDRVGERGVTQR